MELHHVFKTYLERITGKRRFSWHILFLLCVLSLGLYLRIWRIGDYLTFLGDEGRDVLVVKHLIVDHDPVLLGPTASVGGFFLGPLYYYFMAPFLFLFRLDPVGPAVMVALFGVATIGLLYFVGAKFFHPLVGVVASMVYAVSPLVIAYSRSSWNPNIVPFFALLLIYLLWDLSLRRSERNFLWIGIVLGAGIQFHYLFSFLYVLTCIWIVFVYKRAIPLRGLLKLALGFLIPFWPFLLFEIRHGFPNARSLISFFTTGHDTGFSLVGFFHTVFDVSFRSFGRLLFRLPEYQLWNGFPNWQIAAWVIVTRTTLLVGILLLVFFILSRAKNFLGGILGIERRLFILSPAQWTASVLLLLWFGVSLAFFGLYRKEIYDYYFGIFFAAPFLFLGIILWQLTRVKGGIIVSGIALVGLTYFNWQGRPFIYPPNRQLNQTKEIVRVVLDKAGGKPFNFALITATNSDHAYRYFFEIWGNPPVKIENPVLDVHKKTVTDQLLVICENPSCQPLGDSLWDVAGFGRAEITGMWDVSVVKVYRLVHYKPATPSGQLKEQL